MAIFPKNNQRRPKPFHKSRGQSLVEVAIALPFLLILFSGLVEFGFMLNHYVSLTDATRETARYFSNFDPFDVDQPNGDNIINYYVPAAELLKGKLEPDLTLESGIQSTRRIILDPAADDIVISVFSICNGNVVARYPTAGDYHWAGNHTSRFTDAEIANRAGQASAAPASGIVLVEVFYNYHMTLALPFITDYILNPVTLYSYTIMPVSAAEPPCP
jgi:hypothetical protein